MNTALPLLFALVVLWLLVKRLSVGYTVDVSMTLEAPQSEVDALIGDFEQWSRWSPWLMQEPDAEVTLQSPNANGGEYRWQGRLIGAGVVRHLNREPAHQYVMAMSFLRPFKAHSRLMFETTAIDDHQTRVRWQMKGRLPLMMAPMRGWMSKMLAVDFELGLARMAGCANPQSAHPVIVFGEREDRASFHALATRHQTTLSDLPQVFASAFEPLVAQAGAATIDQPVAVYHRIDAKSEAVDVEMAVPVSETTPGAVLVRGGYYFKVVLQGDYRFLKLAWHAAYGQARMRKYKWDASSPALERYVVGRAQSNQSNDWITELYLPIKES